MMQPATIEELAQIIARAAASHGKLELRGGGSKAETGAPRDVPIVDMTGFSGIIDYDPAELVLTAGAGTRLTDIEAALAEREQMLAFEPFGPDSTLGGIIASGSSGSRRLSRGGVRDHLLGFKAVSGRGEAFIAGAKVVKNVTGYDLPKVMAGSWGRLAALTEVTLKILPQMQQSLTLAIEGLTVEAAVALMSKAMGSQADVAAAAHSPGFTAIRVEGFGPSVEARCLMLQNMAPLHILPQEAADRFWAKLHRPLPDADILWRISVPPMNAPATVAAFDGAWLMDWAGARIWLSSDDAFGVRRVAQAAGGHAMLVRAPAMMRRTTPALHPQPAGIAALEYRVRRSFDPIGVFETGRF